MEKIPTPDQIHLESEVKRFRGSKNWFYCPLEKMSPEIERLRERLKLSLFRGPHINVYTDSDVLLEQMRWLNSLFEDQNQADNSKTFGDLYYITKPENQADIPNPQGGHGLKAMTREPADTAYDPISGTCIINAWDRFKSLEGLTLGMRAFKTSEVGLFGMHASLLSRGKEGYILCGGAGSGKSTLSIMMAERGFDLISDDWLEMRSTPDGFQARAVLPTISISYSLFQEMQRESGILKNIEPLGFVSYGKLITDIKMLNRQWLLTDEVRVSKVVLLDNENRIKKVDEKSFLNFQKIINPHIPFFNLPHELPLPTIKVSVDELNLGISEIQAFQSRSALFYEDLARSRMHSIHRIENKSLSVIEIINKIESL